MRSIATLRKEAALAAGDALGMVLLALGPAVVVAVYSLLDLDVGRLPDAMRDLEPDAFVTVLATWLSCLAAATPMVLRERAEGTLQRLAMTPWAATWLVGAKWLVLAVVVIAQAAATATAATLLLDGGPGGAAGWTGAFAVLAATGLCAAALGLLLSATLRSPGQAASAAAVLTLASIVLSGFLKPTADMGALGAVARALPFTLGYDGFRIVEAARLPATETVVLGAEALLLLVAAVGVTKLRAGRAG